MRIAMLLALIQSGCGQTCTLGEVCERICPSGVQAVCSPSQSCVCVADYVQTNAAINPMCSPPSRGDLVMTEVLPDGEPTEAAEFVEVVNRSGKPIDLDGVSLLKERNGRMIGMVLFGYGCLSPKATMALFADRRQWLVQPQPSEPLVASTKRFSLPNNRDFKILLEARDGEILDSIQGLGALIEPGVSLGRAKSELDIPLQKHTEIGLGRLKSPGLCPNGGTYRESCATAQALCATPQPGQLVINEVLIDGEPSEAEEFIELVNQSERTLNLAGISVVSSRGAELAERVTFFGGCLPKAARVALYADPARWVWSTSVPTALDFRLKRFGFSNTAHFRFIVRNALGDIIDQIQGSPTMIRSGESLVRVKKGLGYDLMPHSRLDKEMASPGQHP